MSEPGVVIVLVNWNGKQDTLECLASLSRTRYRNRSVVLVDNGSQDDTVTAVRSAFPEVDVIETRRNLGFTGGNNAGIKRALEVQPDYIFLLNNDTTIEPDTLCRLVDAAGSHPEYGLLTPTIDYYDRPGTHWFSGSHLDLRSGTAIHTEPETTQSTDTVCALPWTTGCAMFFRADLIRRLAGFDERYFLIWEDVDISLRAAASGHGIGLVPAARIYHKVSRSLAKRSMLARYYYVRNNLLLIRMHSGSSYRYAASAVVIRHLCESFRAIKRGEQDAYRAFSVSLCAIRHHVAGRYGAYPGRNPL